MTKTVRVALVAAFATMALSSGAALATSAARASGNTNPVLFVHGYLLNICPGGDTVPNTVPLTNVLRSQGFTGKVDPIAYYACDTNGGVVWQHGSPSAYYPGGEYPFDNTPTSKGGATDNTDIRHIAYQLAWYIYDVYTSKGQPVSVAAHSMGGLISSWMLYQEQIHNPVFPPSLLVQDLVTISTPYAGVNDGYNNLSWCPRSTQCTELLAGSAFTKELQSTGMTALNSSGVDRTAIGGSACDSVDNPKGTTLASGLNSHKVWYNALQVAEPTCYDHTSYLTDTSLALDMPLARQDPGQTTWQQVPNGEHSLLSAAQALMLTSR